MISQNKTTLLWSLKKFVMTYDVPNSRIYNNNVTVDVNY